MKKPMPRRRVRGKRIRKTWSRTFRRFLAGSVGVALVAGLALGGFAYYTKKQLDGNIAKVDILDSAERDALRESQRPDDAPAQDLTVLIMGSDSRAGENGKGIGGETPGLSDTAMLLRIPADRNNIYGVSIPRDSMVQRPSCPLPGGGESPAEFSQFNSAYAVGGPACTVKTLEETTGVYIDHFMVIDFAGFQKMIDLLDGVQICVPESINDPKANLMLDAGLQKLSGKEALGYVRTRYSQGDGSDLGRLKRQQEFLKAVVKQTLAKGLLSDPGRTFELASSGTKLLTTDTEFADVYTLARLAQSLRGLSPDRIVLETAPTVPWPQDTNRVIWTDEAETNWSKLRGDEPIFSSGDAVSVEAGAKLGSSVGAPGDKVDKKATGGNEVSREEKDSFGLC